MKKHLQLFVFILLSLSSFNVFAQNLGDYIFSTGVDATKWITLSNPITLIAPNAGDSKASSVQNIGFVFYFGEDAYTQFSVNTDGNIRLGPMPTATHYYTAPFNSTYIPYNLPKINFMGCNGFLGSTGHVYYQVIGSAPNRVGVIEFATSTYASSSRSAVLKWQVHLYEGSGNIQVVYASTAPSKMPATTRQVGMCVDASDIILVNANHQASHYTEPQSTMIAANQWPEVNRYYLFTVPAVSCYKPGTFVVSSITSNQVTLNWSPRGSETAWEIYITDQTTPPDEYTIPTAFLTNTIYTKTNLQPNTKYYAYIRANCWGTKSGWKKIEFKTTCEPVSSLPLLEDFESYQGGASNITVNNLPECWNYINRGASQGSYPIMLKEAANAASGFNSLCFHTYYTQAYDDQYAIFPPISTTLYPINTLQMEFDAKQSLAADPFILVVGVMSNPMDRNTFIPVDTVVVSESPVTYMPQKVEFDNYTGTGSFIALKAPQPADVNNHGYVDNILISEIPTCIRPTDVTFSNITFNSVNVDWTSMGDETAWNVVVVPHGDDMTTAVPQYTTVHPYTISNLQDETLYDVYVRADCDSGDYSIWTNCKTFSTIPLCSAPIGVSIQQITGTSALLTWSQALYGAVDYTVEYKEEGQSTWMSRVVSGTNCLLSGLTPQTIYQVRMFSNCPMGDADTLFSTFTTKCTYGGEVLFAEGTNTSAQFPVCNGFKYSYTQQLFTNMEMNGPDTIKSLSFQYVGDIAMTSKTNVNIYLGHSALFSFNAVNNYVPIENLQLVYSGPLNCQPGWNTFNLTTPFVYDGLQNLVLAIDDNSFAKDGTSFVFSSHSNDVTRSLYFNSNTIDISPSAPLASNVDNSVSNRRCNIIFGTTCDNSVSCIEPNLYVASVTDDAVTVDWAPGNSENAWNLEYSTDNNNWVSVGTVSNAPYTISDLTSDTPYWVRLQADCGNGETSAWVSVPAHTSCTKLTVPCIEKFETAPNSGAGNMVSCWTTGTDSHTEAVPYTSSTYHNSGVYSVYLHGTTSTYSYLASPCFADQVQMNNLQIQFWAYKTSAASRIQVGIMTNPDDYSTFVQIGSDITPAANSSWEMFEVNTDTYLGNGRYIAFRTSGDVSSNIYIDDIRIYDIPLCNHVRNIEINDSTITANSAEVSWTAGGDETEWEVVYGPAGTITNPEEEAIQFVSGTPSTTLVGMTGNTLYEVFVRASCFSTEKSIWMSSTFRTACESIVALPFVENFDNYDAGESSFPSCWTKINNNSSNSTYIKSSGYNSHNSLYLSAGTSGTYNIAVMQPVDESLPVNMLRAKFMYKAGKSTDRLIVGVMTDPDDASTFVAVDIVAPASSATSWVQRIVDFSNYNDMGRYIAFKNAYTSATCQAYIDNLDVDIMPPCSAPIALSANNITAASANITWSDVAGENVWEILTVPSSDSNPDFSMAEQVGTNSYSLNGLVENTAYAVYVRTVCSNGSGQSDWAFIEFVTPPMLAETPYVCDFGDAAENSRWTFKTSTATNKWYIGRPAGYDDNVMFVSNTGTTATYDNQSPATIWAYRDIHFDESSAEFELSFKWKARGEASLDYMYVYIGDPANVTASGSMTTLVVPQGAIRLSESYMNMSDVWNYFSTTFDGSYAGQTKRLYFLWVNNAASGISPAAVIDSVQMIGKTCGVPYNIHVESITSSSVNIAFSCTDIINSWEYVVNSTNDPSDGVPVPFNTHYLSIDSLAMNTLYYLFVRSDCGGEYSEWSEGLPFRLPCATIDSLPFFENFDAEPISTVTERASNNLPDCWNYYNNGIDTNYTGYPIVFSGTYFSYSGSNVMSFYSFGTGTQYGDQIAVLPPVDNALYPMNSLKLSFQAKRANYLYPGLIVVGVMTNPVDINSFIPVDTVNVPTSTYELFTVYFDRYSGPGNFVALLSPRRSSYNRTYVDDILLEEIPECFAPTNVMATAFTENTITLSWTEQDTTAEWTIEYGTPGFTPGMGVGTVQQVSSNPFVVENLSPNTSYDFYVKAICSSHSESNWTNVITAKTICGPIATLPYEEDFNSYTDVAIIHTPPHSYPNNELPDCWQFVNRSLSQLAYPMAFISSSSSYSASGNCLFFRSSATTPLYAVLPAFTEDIQNLRLHFKYVNQNLSSANGILSVGYMTDPTDENTFVELQSFPRTLSLTEAQQLFMDVPASAASAYITFKYVGGTENDHFLSLDDIVVDLKPDCLKPVGLHATEATTSSVTLEWTEIGTATNWNIEYGPEGFVPGQGTILPIPTNPYTITNLDAYTSYTFYVQADCGNNDYSLWSDGFTVTTPCGSMDLPYEENFDNSYIGTSPSSSSPIPACWMSYVSAGTRPLPHVVSRDSSLICYTSSGTNALMMGAGYPDTESYVVLPSFNTPLNEQILTFFYRHENLLNGTLTIGYVTSAVDMSTFVPVKTAAQTVYMIEDSIDFSTVTANIPAEGNIAFRWQYLGTFANYYYTCCIDDIRVFVRDTVTPIECNVPENLSVSDVSTTTAVAIWTAGNVESSWNLQYKETAAAEWGNSIVVNNVPNFNFTGLLPNTSYQVRVQAVCDADIVSDWTLPISFTTAEEVIVDTCDAPSNLTVSDIHNHDVTLSWTENGTATSWTIYYRVHGNEAAAWSQQMVTANPYTLTNLEGYTEYDYQVVANCTDGETSEPSDIVTERTTNVGVEDYEVSNIDVYPNPTTGMVQVSSSKFQVSGVDVYDVYGKLLNTLSAGGNEAEVNLGEYAAGVYFLRVSTENGVVTKRIVKK